MSAAFHLLGALRRAIGRVLLFFLVFLILGAAIIEIVGITQVSSHQISAVSPVVHIAAAITGLVLGYAAALTVLVGEAIRILLDGIREVEKGVQSEVGDGVKIMDRVVQFVEGKL